MFYHTYILLSKVDHKLYVGWTIDLKKRLDQHNKGLVESTKSRKPFKLVYFDSCLSKDKAIKREKQLKTGFGRAYLKRKI